MERESARRSAYKGRDRATVYHSNGATVSKATEGTLSRDGTERLIYQLSQAGTGIPSEANRNGRYRAGAPLLF